jgi:hypothetical protein
MTANASLTDELMGQLQGAPMQGLAQQLGIDSVQAEQAVGVALPMLFGALGQNTAQPRELPICSVRCSAITAVPMARWIWAVCWAGSVACWAGGGAGAAGGLGGLGSILGSVLGGGSGAGNSQLDAGAILGNIFGGQQQQAESQLGQATGLGGNAGQLLACWLRW